MQTKRTKRKATINQTSRKVKAKQSKQINQVETNKTNAKEYIQQKRHQPNNKLPTKKHNKKHNNSTKPINN